MFGRYSFNLSVYFMTHSFLLKHGYGAAIREDSLQRNNGALNLMKMRRIRNRFRHDTTTALGLLEDMRDFDAVDARDRILGVQSTMKPQDRIVADYGASTEQIYIQFAAQQVGNNHGIDLFDTAGLHRRLPTSKSLPTWVLDWRAQTKHPRIISSIRQIPYRASGDLVDQSTLFKASANLESIFLSRGIIFDTSRQVTDTIASNDESQFLRS